VSNTFAEIMCVSLRCRRKGRETAEETEKIVKKIIEKDMEVKQAVEVSIVHRTGRRRTDQPRPVICRVVRKKDKALIMRSKKNLRQSRPAVSVEEDLTVARLRMVRDLRQNERIAKVWTLDGKVSVEEHNGARVFNASRETDLNSLLDGRNRVQLCGDFSGAS